MSLSLKVLTSPGVWVGAVGLLALPLASGAYAVDAQSTSGTVVSLQNAATGKCLDVPGRTTSPARLIQWDCTGGSNQQFTVTHNGDGTDSYASVASGLCLDVQGESADDGAPLIQYGCHGGANQRFTVSGGDGLVALVSQSSGKCVDVPYDSLHDNGAAMQQWQCYHNDDQGFRVVSAAGGGGSTPAPAPPPPPAGSASSKLDGIALPARGWFSGAAGDGANSGTTAFGDWRGDATDSMADWIASPDGQYWDCGCNTPDGKGPAAKFKGMVDEAIGGPSDWHAAAQGSLDDKLRTMLTHLRAARTIDGVLYPTLIRPAHEANGNWYAWQVTADKVDDFKATMRRWRAVLDQVYPEALFEFGMSGETTTNVKVSDMYESGVWDVIGSDRYNQWPYIGTSYSGVFTSWDDAANQGSDDNPKGAESWRAFAQKRGLPLYFSEYGNNGSRTDPSSGDDAYWLQHFFPWVQAHAGKGAGQVLGENYFNVSGTEDNKWPVFRDDGSAVAAPHVAQAYADEFPVK